MRVPLTAANTGCICSDIGDNRTLLFCSFFYFGTSISPFLFFYGFYHIGTVNWWKLKTVSHSNRRISSDWTNQWPFLLVAAIGKRRAMTNWCTSNSIYCVQRIDSIDFRRERNEMISLSSRLNNEARTQTNICISNERKMAVFFKNMMNMNIRRQSALNDDWWIINFLSIFVSCQFARHISSLANSATMPSNEWMRGSEAKGVAMYGKINIFRSHRLSHFVFAVVDDDDFMPVVISATRTTFALCICIFFSSSHRLQTTQYGLMLISR